MPKTKKNKIYQKPTNEQLSYLPNKSKVLNTYKSTKNWIDKFQQYRSDVGSDNAPEDIDNVQELEVQLCEFFAVAEKGDGSPYSVNSLLAAIRAINRFYNSSVSKIKPVNLCDRQAFPDLCEILDGKTKDLAEKGYGETHGSDSLSFEEIQSILQHEATSRNTPEGLLYRIFLYNAIFLALRGGEHYTLMLKNFQKRKDGGFDVYIYKSKTNQRGLDNLGAADKISIPVDNSVIIEDYEKYFSKRPVNADPGFYLHPIGTKSAPERKINAFMRILAEKTGINCEDRKITNQAGRKTLVQRLKDLGTSDYEVSTITRHRSLSSLARYERPKDGVQKATLNSLMTILETPDSSLDVQVPQSNMLPTTDSYNQFRSARQIYQANHASKLRSIPPQ
ncbi:2104_t:CDS:2, partial [Cetraspora pellucida]